MIVVLIVAFGAGGALYYSRYGDRTTTNYHAIQEKTKELLKIEVPERLWPRMMITRPDVMTMVFYASKNDETCLAVMSCLPAWARERGHRPDRLLQATVEQYFPQFNTERWTGTEERDVPVGGASRAGQTRQFLSDRRPQGSPGRQPRQLAHRKWCDQFVL